MKKAILKDFLLLFSAYNAKITSNVYEKGGTEVKSGPKNVHRAITEEVLRRLPP